MKFFAAIMAFEVLFLSVQPAFALFSNMQKTESCISCCRSDNVAAKK